MRSRIFFTTVPYSPQRSQYCEFQQQAFTQLSVFTKIVKQQLSQSACIHVDETGVNINGKRHWLHSASNDSWTDFSIKAKRGVEAMNEADILPHFKGVLCHDHWKPYYRFDGCKHALCNAHHLRELTRAYEQDNQQWAGRMKALLEIINRATYQAERMLSTEQQQRYRRYYHRLLSQADRECPGPTSKDNNKRGGVKRSKARNLLELSFRTPILN
jgi:transposase